MEPSRPLRVRFGSFELNLKTAELTNGQQTIVLPRQSFAILILLLEAAGDMVERGEIKSKLWPNDTEVDFDHSINAAIRNLRRALGDSAEKPEYIETLTGRGYRLIVSAEWLPSTAVEAAPQDPGPDERLPSGDLTGRKVSHYRILGIIGGGGMGVVYKAEDLKLGRVVAIKFLPEELGSDPRALERFEQEARTASSLDHPNICHIYEFGDHAGQPFIVMQLLEGQTLRERMAFSESEAPAAQDGKTIPLEEALDIALQILSGLAAAHAKGIIHRDIKPANILVTKGGTAKILDFGLAKLLQVGEQEASPPRDRSHTPTTAAERASSTLSFSRTGAAMGTAGYMSPEQVRGEKLDTRTDLFSFGVVFYEMLTGQRAFGGEDITSVHAAILNSSPLPLLQANSALPPRINEIVNKCLQKERASRYQTADELAADLKGIPRSPNGVQRESGEEIQTVPRGWRRPLREWFSQKWLTIALLLLLSAGALMGIRYYDKQRPLSSIAILPYLNESSDPTVEWMGSSIAATVSFDLGWSDYLFFISSKRLQQTRLGLHVEPDSTVDAATLKTLAASLNAENIVVGRYRPFNGGIQIVSTVYNVGNDRSVDLLTRVGSVAELSGGLSVMAGDIRERLVLSSRTYRELLTNSRQLSINAMRAYEEGARHASAGENAEAAKSFEQAISIDPNFALAYSSLADIYSLLGESDNAQIASSKALNLSAKLSRQERSLVQSTYDNIRDEKSRGVAFESRMKIRSPGESIGRSASYALWILSGLLEALVLGLMYKFVVYRDFLLFFIYLAIEVLTFIVEFAFRNYRNYYYIYWVAAVVTTIVAGAVTFDFIIRVFRARKHWSVSNITLFRRTIVGLLIAAIAWPSRFADLLNVGKKTPGTLLCVLGIVLSAIAVYDIAATISLPDDRQHQLSVTGFRRIATVSVALMLMWLVTFGYLWKAGPDPITYAGVYCTQFLTAVQIGFALSVSFLASSLDLSRWGVVFGFGLDAICKVAVNLTARLPNHANRGVLSTELGAAYIVSCIIWLAWALANRGVAANLDCLQPAACDSPVMPATS